MCFFMVREFQEQKQGTKLPIAKKQPLIPFPHVDLAFNGCSVYTCSTFGLKNAGRVGPG